MKKDGQQSGNNNKNLEEDRELDVIEKIYK